MPDTLIMAPPSRAAIYTPAEIEMAFQLNTYKLHDPSHEIVRRSLERERDPEPHDRQMTDPEVVREIAAIGSIAANQAERNDEATRLAVLRQKAPISDHERALRVSATGW